MTIRTVMVYVDAAQQAEEQVRVARDVANRFGASIIGVSALAIPPPVVAEEVVIQATTADDVKRMKATLVEKEDWFRKVVGMPKERTEWRWDIAGPTMFLINEARAADLIVMKGWHRGADEFRFVDPAEAILRLGRPAIVVPEHVSELKADRVVIGWKDTREARIAVLQALPFLARASEVTIVELCLSDEQDSARRRVEDVARYLSLRGAKCHTDVRVHTASADADHLVRLAKAADADLIVTGAYGHSRLGEWIFGGMTRGLLKDAPCCLMMSH
ncbi:MAG: universal stress protein [Bradyrhizobium sp.]|nr:universal stress protein [Pseudomonadota bacterium]MDE2469598.1 universal stress protein [Bradyrhizobium sp.]